MCTKWRAPPPSAPSSNPIRSSAPGQIGLVSNSGRQTFCRQRPSCMDADITHTALETEIDGLGCGVVSSDKKEENFVVKKAVDWYLERLLLFLFNRCSFTPCMSSFLSRKLHKIPVRLLQAGNPDVHAPYTYFRNRIVMHPPTYIFPLSANAEKPEKLAPFLPSQTHNYEL